MHKSPSTIAAERRANRSWLILEKWLVNQGGVGLSKEALEYQRKNDRIGTSRFFKMVRDKKDDGILEVHKTENGGGHALALRGRYGKRALNRTMKKLRENQARKQNRNQPPDPTPEEIKQRCEELKARDFAMRQDIEYAGCWAGNAADDQDWDDWGEPDIYQEERTI